MLILYQYYCGYKTAADLSQVSVKHIAGHFKAFQMIYFCAINHECNAFYVILIVLIIYVL